MNLTRRQVLAAGTAAAVLPAAYFGSGLLPAFAQAPDLGQPSLPNPGFRKMRLGDIEIIALNDGVARRPLREEFVRNAPLAEVQAMLRAQGLATEYIDIPFNAFLLVMGQQRVLLDSGFADNGGPTTGRLLGNLNAAGFKAEDITAVLISHYHGDHINGLRNKAGQAVFSKAKVYVPEQEHAFWMDDARMNAAPEAGRGGFLGARRVFNGFTADQLLRFAPGAEVLPGVQSIAAFGHTPGHTLFRVRSGNQSFVYLADLTNVPQLFARNPDWAVQFDMDADAARRVRRQMFDMVVNDKAVAGGFHFPFPAFGTIERAGNGFEFKAMA
jgi:glyoxylase-like metal-dependent hydrolase (beta-lactamase superfamily II)